MSTLRATLKESRTQPSDSSHEARDQDPCWPNICCSRYSDTLCARRSVHPTLGHHTTLHSDTTSGYTLGYTLTYYTRKLSSGSVRLTRARQHFTTSRSVLQTRVHRRMNTPLIHDPCSGSMLSSSCYFHCSSSSSQTTVHTHKFERCTQNHARSLSLQLKTNRSFEAHKFLLSNHGSIPFLNI